MKFKVILPFVFTILGSLTSHADRIGNGGDVCESRILTIRNDISAWMTKNGAAALKLQKGLPLARFNTGMMSAFTKTSVACVDEKLFVGAAEKTCKNVITLFGKSFIRCNYSRFMATTETDQYMLIHHEYAGVAGFEVNSGEESDYAISRQITGFLQDEVIKRLVVPSTSHSARVKTCDLNRNQQQTIPRIIAKTIYEMIVPELQKLGIETATDPKVSLILGSNSSFEFPNSIVFDRVTFETKKGTKMAIGLLHSREDPNSYFGVEIENTFDVEGNISHCKLNVSYVMISGVYNIETRIKVAQFDQTYKDFLNLEYPPNFE